MVYPLKTQINKQINKWCALPQCKNTSIKAPNKVFVHVPNKKIMRDKWLNLARRNPNDVVSSPLYFCEDHFDLPNDMENFMQYHVMGFVSQVRMKEKCINTEQSSFEEISSGSSEMVRCRAEYMRAYREKKREEKVKSQLAEPKKIARNSTQRSRDFRARAASLRLSQTSIVDPPSASPNLVVSDEISHLEQEVQHTENFFNENTLESYIAKVDKTNQSIDPFSSNVKQEKTFDEFENNIGVWIKTEDEFENFNSTSAIDNIKQEPEDAESLPNENTFETYISRFVNVDPSSHLVKEEINAEVQIKTEDDIHNSAIYNIKQEFEDTGSISNENNFETYISRLVNIDPSSHLVKEEINAEVWIKTEVE